VPPERRSLQLSCCEPGASYYAEAFSPLPGRCFRLVTGTARTARHTARSRQRGVAHSPPETGRHTGSRRARVTGRSTSRNGLPHAKGRAVLVPIQFAGGLTSNASSSTNETKHPAEGSQVWTRVRASWWLVGLLEDLELQPQPCSDPSGRWSRWRRTSIRRGHGVSPWVYRGLSPRGGCGGCPVAVASGHEAAG
jgi:hypothetical protein